MRCALREVFGPYDLQADERRDVPNLWDQDDHCTLVLRPDCGKTGKKSKYLHRLQRAIMLKKAAHTIGAAPIRGCKASGAMTLLLRKQNAQDRIPSGGDPSVAREGT
jgi:hypothetical protein